ncbi:allophanate hydrolase [Caldalkalibacillus thermarum]|uniref:5-oxoprolinase subunit PxpB n=1 Tax=Caldalkalibacillus thermarum TaxID=296745 RepID=UPI001662F837|nr:5-oxoprolinase subunit PxpB [Caldalkalibacillus thermarum]GGK22138.1 allophanate hydrolase [Caldalkalibacillus thermarum]
MFKITPLGDTGIRVQLGNTISPGINQLIRSFSLLLEQDKHPGIIEWIPTYTSITLFYDPYVIGYEELTAYLGHIKGKLHQADTPAADVIHIPTCYGGKLGPDLENVARHNGLAPDEVIKIHSEPLYLIYMLGFTPGFPYLGGMSKRIATPRLDVPRSLVPAGSVGIAGEQTGIYPMETPGGWQIIGRTPVKLYDPSREPSILLKAGNYVKFVPISYDEYTRIEKAIEQGCYQPRITTYGRET